MDLIPIIEYTLLIFIGLLLIVILTSYLIFAWRKRIKSEDEHTAVVREYLPPEPEVNYLIPVRSDEYINPEVEYYSRTSSFKSANNQKPSSRFTILNPNAMNSSGYSQERVTSFDHRFAPTKSKDAFAMFN